MAEPLIVAAGSMPEKLKLEYLLTVFPAMVVSATTVDCPQLGFQVVPVRSVYASLKMETTFAASAVGVGGAVVGSVGSDEL